MQALPSFPSSPPVLPANPHKTRREEAPSKKVPIK